MDRNKSRKISTWKMIPLKVRVPKMGQQNCRQQALERRDAPVASVSFSTNKQQEQGNQEIYLPKTMKDLQ